MSTDTKKKICVFVIILIYMALMCIGIACFVEVLKFTIPDTVDIVISSVSSSSIVKSGAICFGTSSILYILFFIINITMLNVAGIRHDSDRIFNALFWNFIFAMLVALLQVICVFIMWIPHLKVQNDVADSLKFNSTDYLMNKELRDQFDIIQKNLMCCGASSPDDYGEMFLPLSCMNADNFEPYKIGCVEAVQKYLSRATYSIGGLGIAMAVIMVFMFVPCTWFMCFGYGMNSGEG